MFNESKKYIEQKDKYINQIFKSYVPIWFDINIKDITRN
jgi:hypothetical protein